VEVNQKLTLANGKLEEAVAAMQGEMRGMKERQAELARNNQEYCIKLESVEKVNATLNEHISQQLSCYQVQVTQKDLEVSQTKKKYDRLLGSLKMATEA
jgi:hypothetical protein